MTSLLASTRSLSYTQSPAVGIVTFEVLQRQVNLLVCIVCNAECVLNVLSVFGVMRLLVLLVLCRHSNGKKTTS